MAAVFIHSRSCLSKIDAAQYASKTPLQLVRCHAMGHKFAESHHEKWKANLKFQCRRNWTRARNIRVFMPRYRDNLLQGQVQRRRAFTSNNSRRLPSPKPGSPSYKPPKSGFLSKLPRSWIPYGELMRLDKPAGTYYLFFPCLFSTFLAASYTHAGILPVLTTAFYFFSGALIMRGAGCSINDLWDRNLDPQVARTRLRPIARGAITPFKALTFTGFELLAGLAVLVQFPFSCLYYGIPSLALVATYPLAKRVTHYPQFVLGLTFSWGAIMGFPALGVDLIADSTALQAVACLYMSCVSWTVLYDMIYAHMDIKDDAKAGIKSIALRHEKETKAVLTGLAILQVGLLAVAGSILDVSPVFFVGSCGSAAATLGLMIWKVKLKEVRNCWWWFKHGAFFTGGGIASGMLAEYISTDHSVNEKIASGPLQEKSEGRTM